MLPSIECPTPTLDVFFGGSACCFFRCASPFRFSQNCQNFPLCIYCPESSIYVVGSNPSGSTGCSEGGSTCLYACPTNGSFSEVENEYKRRITIAKTTITMAILTFLSKMVSDISVF